MSKQAINVFDLQMYRCMIKHYESLLGCMKKSVELDGKLDGYYTRDEVKYICESCFYALKDLVHGKLFEMFVPKKVLQDFWQRCDLAWKKILIGDWQSAISTFDSILDLVKQDVTQS